MHTPHLQSLITRMHAARVIAVNKGRHDLAGQCLLKISTLQSLGSFNPSYVAGVEMIERDCRDAITMSEVRARYAQFSSGAPPSVGEPRAIASPARGSTPSSRKAA